MKHWLALVVALACGCTASSRGLYPPAPGAVVKTVHVISRDLHSGLVVACADLPTNQFPVVQDFPGVDHLEFGWGDAAYYQAAEPGLGLGVKALFWPTPSVLHVAGRRGALPTGAVVTVQLSEAGFARLRDFVAQSFQYDSQAQPVLVGSSLSDGGRFYAARGKFYFPKTCNWWAALALREAGCPIAPLCVFTAPQVMARARVFTGKKLVDPLGLEPRTR